MDFDYKASEIDAYGDTENVIHFKFGDARKMYNFTPEFEANNSEFCKEYANYFMDSPSKFKSVTDVVDYIESHNLPVKLYSNYVDREFADVDAVRRWIKWNEPTEVSND